MSVTINFGAKPCFLSSLHQPQRRPGVPPTLNQHVENLAPWSTARQRYSRSPAIRTNHLVEMPAIARSRATPTQPSRDPRTELQHPAPHRFVGDVEPPFGQELLDIAIAQSETEIEPHRVLDDLGREAMAVMSTSYPICVSSRPSFRDNAGQHIGPYNTGFRGFPDVVE